MQCATRGRHFFLWSTVTLSPRLSAMPWVLLRIRTWPWSTPSAFSMLKFASASSPARRPAKPVSATQSSEAKEVGRTEQASGVHVGREEAAVARQRGLWGEARHVGRGHDVVQVCAHL